ncbi:SDR family NAD(P)-dependent oxidoreductase [Paraburkholderia sp. GAS334]|uniref:SDR family NAD(P)-dependent oxidoreductase n=1 Tax=Paraburkholderia sp. GAS334 TaxID=3035131 RepID=UPI003D1CEEAB
MLRLSNKVAIITGAASGIGRSAAQLFAREGASVVVADIDPAAAAEVVTGVRADGGTAIAITTDVTQSDSVAAMIEATVAEFGKLDILYNNAGGSTPRDNTVVDADLEEFWRVVKVDLWGTFLGCRFAIPHMRKNGGGAIVNMVSNVALMGVPGVDCYTSAKGGVAALTRSLAVTYAADRIRVNAIAPSTTLSPRVIERLQVSQGMRELNAKNLLGAAEPIDIAYAALFLASDEARVTTGSIFLAESGTTVE